MTGDKKISDQEFNAYLNGDSELSKIYADSKEIALPEFIEKKIRRIAQESKQVAIHKRSWFLPASIAASVVLAVLIVITVNFQNNETIVVVENNKTAEEHPSQPQITEPKKIKQAENTSPELKPAPAQTNQRLEAQKSDTSIASVEPQQNAKTNQTEMANESSDFRLPEQLQDMLQPAASHGKTDLPPAEILKQWTREQWQEQVQTLHKANQQQLAKKYIDEYPKYYPGETLQWQE